MNRFTACCLLVLGAGCLGWIACGGGGNDLDREAGSALWIDPAAGPVEVDALYALQDVGVQELFVDAAQLTWDGGTPQLATHAGDLPDVRTSATLVIHGAAPPPDTDLEAAADRLVPELRRLARGVRGTGWVPRGFHWDLDLSAEDLPPMASLLDELDARLDGETYLSVTLPRSLLDDPAAEDVARAADFVVAFLYGQRDHEAGDDPTAWDFQEVSASLERLEALGQQYLLGVSTVGRLIVEGDDAVVTRVHLSDLVESPAFEERFGMSLQGIDRRVYDYRTTEPVRLGDLELPAGADVRLSFLSAIDLHQLFNLATHEGTPLHRGQVYWRPPAPTEGLSVPPEVLARALSGDVPQPQPEVRLESSGRRLTVHLTNDSPVGTEVARMDMNYVELRLGRGSFARVDPGDFPRYDLLDGDTGRRTVRDPDVLRLYLPYLPAGRQVASGPVVLSGAGTGNVSVAGSFLAPGDEVVPVVSGDAESTVR